MRVNATILAAIDSMLDAQFADVEKLALHTGDPGAAGTSNELDGDNAPGYDRQPISFAASADGVKATDADVEFLAEDDWVVVTHGSLWDDGDAFLASFELTAPRQVGDGATLKFASGDFQIKAGSIET